MGVSAWSARNGVPGHAIRACYGGICASLESNYDRLESDESVEDYSLNKGVYKRRRMEKSRHGAIIHSPRCLPDWGSLKPHSRAMP